MKYRPTVHDLEVINLNIAFFALPNPCSCSVMNKNMFTSKPNHIIQFCSGITRDRVLSGELYPEDWREIFMKQFVDKYK